MSQLRWRVKKQPWEIAAFEQTRVTIILKLEKGFQKKQ